MSDKVEIYLDFIMTLSACIVVSDGDENIYLPISLVEYDTTAVEGDLVAVTMPGWLAMDRGLI